MTEYSNPEVPHEVNVGKSRPILDFLRLLSGLCLVLAAVVSLVYFGARFFAPKIPFRYEGAFNESLLKGSHLFGKHPAFLCAAEEKIALQTLQSMAEGLSVAMDLPEEMNIHVRFFGGRDPNAFATLGGNVAISRALLKNIHTENGLAMVLAHEIAHIRHRDPIVSLGGGAAVALLLSAFTGNADGGLLAAWVADSTRMSFSRAQEDKADSAALAALKTYYGYSNGADEFFVYIIKKRSETPSLPVFFGTHPMPEARLQAILSSFDSVSRPLKPLPDELLRLKSCWPGTWTDD
ncbi:MAG: M48 family metallopeptidase [Candidatus Accumulibacter sp.]|jgi:Zn-dependent protease with chaperone function|nr:M48 family metallopeptidase [Accumulibacter sp.]